MTVKHIRGSIIGNRINEFINKGVENMAENKFLVSDHYGHLALDLVRVTEVAALAAAQYMGTGNKNAGDQAAVDAMRKTFASLEIDGLVVIGEGEKDNAPMLYNGERLGNGMPPAVDLAVDPVEGTNLLALGRANAISVIALSMRGGMWNPGPSLYMDKLVVDQRARDVVDITKSPIENLRRVAKALNRQVNRLTVFVLDKPRHANLIRQIRLAGARVSLQTDGDVAGALQAAIPGSGVDVLMGIGGTPEAVITAAAVKALRGGLQVRCAPQSDAELMRVRETFGETWDAVRTENDLIPVEDAFFAATGITTGPLLEGVHYDRVDGITTHSMVIRVRTGTIRYIKATHRRTKLAQLGKIEYAETLE